MAHVIQLTDGSTHTIFGERDIISLVDEYLGYEARTELEELLSEHDPDADYIDELESELKGAKDHHREVMEQLRTQSETIAGLIREKDIDRNALSKAAGVIGSITWRELSVR
ncbi:hypothetical protein [Chordicoccus furentiruminis]|uniref:hypothetical protein n=1 Tax=Chordicoccus furentiruminis TaxID=2709410 RepID=UPI0023A8622F|nr:hypothetical protein [Chordicoccus furentiruminis]